MFFRRTKPEWIIVGLGNPGPAYTNTRHNVGFVAIDRLAEKLGVKIDRVKYSAYTATAAIGGKTVLLMKPTTFMNLSGQAVRQAARYYAIEPEKVLVIFDDVSLAPGRIRVRADGSAGGHNGIKSIISELGSQAFPRVKIGVGERPHPDYDLADWVLGKFSSEDRKKIETAVENACGAVEALIEKGVTEAANRYNGR
ncbi:MAG: aminoacyl-tRNA hydrolase [Ruminococcaceae bacterium]|nr:aminoacyl-tRNA hydrolase [Oscillospiraceae bacterium]